MKSTLLPLIAFVGLAIAPAASASDKFEIDFEYSPVEVSTEYGAKQVYAELEAEITKQCTPNVRPIERLQRDREIRACIDEAIGTAVAQINQPEVSKVHKAKRG